MVGEGIYDEYEIGDDIVIGGYEWEITGKNEWELPIVGMTYFFNLSREIDIEGAHHEVWINYWHVYNYSFFNWNYLREERRAA